MEQLDLHFTGTSDLLMHRPTGVDVLSVEKQEQMKYTGKQRKTTDDYEIIKRLDWEMGLYFDEELGPYIPGVNVEIMLRDAAKLTKQGAAITRGVVVIQDKLPVQYKGPRRSIEELWDANLKDYRVVGNQQNSVMRCRPKFPGWSLDVSMTVEGTIITASDVRGIAVKAGKMIGLGDYRPRFGRFEVS